MKGWKVSIASIEFLQQLAILLDLDATPFNQNVADPCVLPLYGLVAKHTWALLSVCPKPSLLLKHTFGAVSERKPWVWEPEDLDSGCGSGHKNMWDLEYFTLGLSLKLKSLEMVWKCPLAFHVSLSSPCWGRAHRPLLPSYTRQCPGALWDYSLAGNLCCQALTAAKAVSDFLPTV